MDSNMTFTNQYLSYKEYQALGGTLLEVPFNRLEYKSCKKVDELTSKRITKLETIPQEVKLCVFDLINVFNDDENPILENDGVGTYNPGKRSIEEIEKVKINIVNNYLNELYIDGVSATYRGCDV